MSRYVTFPGVAGSYASTEDNNVLDGDTGNLVQSIGQWHAWSAGVTNLALTPSGLGFGPNVLTWTAGNATDPALSTAALGITGVVPVTEGETVAFAAEIRPSNTSDDQIEIVWIDAGGGLISTTPSSFTTITAGVWKQYDFSGVAPATTAFALCIFKQVNVTDGWTYELRNPICRLAASALPFVPSVRIVGDVQSVYDMHPDEWVPTADVVWLYFGQANICRQRTVGRIGIQWPGSSLWSPAHGITSGRHTIVVKGMPASGFSYSIDGGSETSGGAAYTPDFTALGNLRQLTVADRSPTLFPYAGDVFSVTLHDGIDGPIVASFEPSDIVL